MSLKFEEQAGEREILNTHTHTHTHTHRKKNRKNKKAYRVWKRFTVQCQLEEEAGHERDGQKQTRDPRETKASLAPRPPPPPPSRWSPSSASTPPTLVGAPRGRCPPSAGVR